MGHGHVTPNPDGSKARCGGPAICHKCALEQARQDALKPPAPAPPATATGAPMYRCYDCGQDYFEAGHLCPARERPACTPHCCPVCLGRGRVDRDFYGDTMNASKYIVCQSCSGTGVLWS